MSATAPALRDASFDPAEADRFLELLFPGDFDFPSAARVGPFALPSKRVAWTPPGDRAATITAAASWTGEAGVYAHAALHDVGSVNGRGSNDSALVATALWADLDVLLPGHRHKAGALPRDLDALEELLAALAIPPSVRVHSGFGLQAYWLLREPVALSDPEERARYLDAAARLEHHVATLADERGWTFDRVADLARVLRLPGSVNAKNPDALRPVRLLDGHGTEPTRYNLADFLELPEAPPQTAVPDGARVPLADDERAALASRLVAWALRRAATARGRNPAGFDLACQLRDAGFTRVTATTYLREYAARVRALWPERNYADEEALGALRQAFKREPRSSLPALRSPAPPTPTRGALALAPAPPPADPGFDAPPDEAYDEDQPGNVAAGGGRESAAAVLVELAVASTHLFHDDRDGAFAAIGPVEARRIVPIRSGVFSQFLSGLYYQSRGKAANGENLAAAKNVLGFKARFEGPRHVLHNRFAAHDGALWIDLADEGQRAVRVTPDGWTVTTPPILFRRFGAQAPLPEPRTGGDLRKLLSFVNVRAEQDEVLLLAWLTTAVLGHVARPILDLYGPQGSAKTTAAKMLRALTDPSAAASNRLSHQDDELALTLETNAVPFFDNVTAIPARAAELLCQAVTGGGFSKRELYSDSDEIVYSFRRAILITGINVPTHAPDLLDRLLLVQLDRVAREDRRPDAGLWHAFDAAVPAIFGGLLDALAGAMRVHPETERTVSTLERLADFTLWGASVAEALGFGRAAFLDAYSENVARQTDEVLEADPVARAVRDLVARRGAWSGTPSDLLSVFRADHGEEMKAKDSGWPARAEGLGRRLRILHSTLADVGISVRWGRRAGRERVRTVTLEPGAVRDPGEPSQPSHLSQDQQGQALEEGRRAERTVPNRPPEPSRPPDAGRLPGRTVPNRPPLPSRGSEPLTGLGDGRDGRDGFSRSLSGPDEEAL